MPWNNIEAHTYI